MLLTLHTLKIRAKSIHFQLDFFVNRSLIVPYHRTIRGVRQGAGLLSGYIVSEKFLVRQAYKNLRLHREKMESGDDFTDQEVAFSSHQTLLE